MQINKLRTMSLGIDEIVDIRSLLPSREILESDESSDGGEEAHPDTNFVVTSTKINNIQILFPGPITIHQNQIITTVTANLLNGSNGMVDFLNEEERQVAVLAGVLAYCCKDFHIARRENFNLGAAYRSSRPTSSSTSQHPLSSTKIILATKSFMEIPKIIRTLKKFEQTGYLDYFKMTVIGRHHELCKRYAKRSGNSSPCEQPPEFPDFSFIERGESTTIHSLHDLAKAAKLRKFCAYFFSTHTDLVSQANIIICPQDIFLSEFWRSVYGINLERSIVLFDEAKNIESSCYNEGNFIISAPMLSFGGKNLQNYMNALQEENDFIPHPNVLQNMICLAKSIQKLSDQIVKDHSSQPPNQITLQTLENCGFNESTTKEYFFQFQRLFLYIEESESKERIPKLHDKDRTICNVSKLLSTISYIQTLSEHKFCIATFKPYKNVHRPLPSCDLKIVLNDIHPVMQPILDNSMAVFISSGCLSPIQILRDQLGFDVFNPNDDAIIRDQSETSVKCFLRYCESGPNGVKFHLNHSHKDSASIQEEVGDSIVQICRNIPNGVIVYFPSKDTLTKMTDRWKENENRATSIYDELKTIKHIFQEPEKGGLEDVKLQLSNFLEKCKNPLPGKTGAVFFALYRGKVCDLLECKNGEVKMMISCGLPYANITALHIDQKIKYLKFLDTEWRLWYNGEMFRILNQAIAQLVQNGDEWVGAIILDLRVFDKNNQFDVYLPSWMEKNMRENRDFKKMIKEMKRFIQDD